MKVLVVCRKKNTISPFIKEQVDALIETGVDIQYFFINGNGHKAYISNISSLKKQIKSFKPDIIHAHYGLSGLFANLQRSVPVVTTFHGSDINLRKIRFFSQIAMKLSKYNIFISEKLAQQALAKKNFTILPCGVDFDTFYPLDKKPAREKLKLDHDIKYILFAGSFENKIKNVSLAREVIKHLGNNVHLIELKAYTREEVNLLLNACDVLLMTSLMEGSPQIIKEAMACNCPIVSTDVGDVKQNIESVEGCYITSFEPKDVVKKIDMAIQFGNRTTGREKIIEFDNKIIGDKIFSFYNSILR